MVRRSSRSRSRGREVYQAGEVKSPRPPRTPRTPKSEPAAAKDEMDFTVGDSVMAKWPGSKLFYVAKVQLVRPDDNEYDVEYENGSVFTIPAKDVLKQSNASFRKAAHATRSKSQSRRRSKGRSQKTRKKAVAGEEVAEAGDSSADETLPDISAPKTSNSSRVSRRSTASKVATSPKASNSSRISVKEPKASNSSRVSSKAPRTSNTSYMSNKAATDAFSEDDTDDLGMLSVSARPSRSSLVEPSNDSELELLATDQTQLNEDSETAPDAPAARASISSRISSLIFGSSTPAKDTSVSSKVDTSLDAVSEDEEEVLPPSASAKASASSRVSVSSKKASVSSRISSILFGDAAPEKTTSSSSKADNGTVEASEAEENEENKFDTLELRSRTVTETLSPIEDLGQDAEEEKYDTLELRSRTITETLSPLDELGQDKDEDEPKVSVSSRKSSRRVSSISKKASVSSRLSAISERASESSRNVSNGSKINGDSAETAPSVDVTEEVEAQEKGADEKTSISSKISGIIFGGTPKASTSSKVSETAEGPAKVDDIAAAENASFPYIARRSSRASTRASTIASKASPRVSTTASNSSRLDEFSEDDEKIEGGGAQLPAEEEKADGGSGEVGQWGVEWLWAVFFMVLCPAILVSLHTICTGDICSLAVPRLSINPRDYIDYEAIGMVISFVLLLRVLEFLCMGREVQGYRMNGFQSLLLVLLMVPVFIYHGFPIERVTSKYFHLMCAAIFLSYGQALLSLVLSHATEPSTLSTKGNTGNPLVDLFHGRELNPILLGANLKLQTFRCSMVGLALLNTLLVTEACLAKGVNPTVVIAATYQILYALDAMYYEDCYFYSHDSLYSGFGWSLISSYLTFPFLPTLVTRYLVAASPALHWTALAAITTMNLLGYYIYRNSENQRCQLAKDPSHPSLAHLTTLEGAKGRRLITSGWWGLVRHPNYLGELLVQWSWVLPAAPTLGLVQLVPYYLPVITTLMLVLRCLQINKRNSKKFGGAWTEYTARVRSNIVPLVF